MAKSLSENMQINIARAFLFASPFVGQSFALVNSNQSAPFLLARSAQTCGDPTTAIAFERAWSLEDKVFVYEQRQEFIALIAAENTNPILQGTAFLAFATQETGTIPWYVGFNTATKDRLFVLSPSGTIPPFPTGYTNDGILFFVYDSAVCGSVPLMEAIQSKSGGHFYTVDQNEMNAMVASAGYEAQGVVGFVLAPSTSCGCEV